MALLAFESFDHYTTALMTTKLASVNQQNSYAFISAGNGRNSSAAFLTDYSGLGYIKPRLFRSIASTTCGVGIAIRTKTGSLPGSDSGLLSVLDGSTDQLTLVLTSSGTLKLFRGSYVGTLLGTSAAVIAAATYYFIELLAVIADSGSYEVRVNGANVLSGSADTNNGGASTYKWTTVTFGGASSGAYYMDDAYVIDGAGSSPFNTFLGDNRVVALVAQSGNGTHTDWSPSAGSDRGAMVDEATPDDDTTYNSTATVGHRNSYNLPAVGVAGTVGAVAQSHYLKCTVAGGRTVTAIARIGGTTYEHPTPQAIGTTTYSYYTWLWETDPATGVAWLVAAIDAAEFGLKVTA